MAVINFSLGHDEKNEHNLVNFSYWYNLKDYPLFRIMLFLQLGQILY